MAEADKLLDRLASRLKMRHLTLLLEIQRHGSLTRVAQQMATSQPAVTHALAELEAIFGAPLFLRSARGMAPTPLGEVALTRARSLLQDLDHWAREMDAVDAGYAAHLNVGVIPFVSGALVCDAIRNTMSGARKLAVTIREATSDQLLLALRNHEIDCLIARASSATRLPDILHEVLYHQRPRLIAGQRLGARLARLPLDWGKLAQLEWILPAPSTPIGTMIADLFIRSGVKPPSPVIESYSLKIIGGMISDSDNMVSIVPEDIADELKRTAAVAVVPYELDWELPPVALIRRQREVPLQAEEAFAQSLRVLCRSMRRSPT
jgi:DNA-binding transcriptional LysR family regulator